jgi:hypothetical protein
MGPGPAGVRVVGAGSDLLEIVDGLAAVVRETLPIYTSRRGAELQYMHLPLAIASSCLFIHQ